MNGFDFSELWEFIKFKVLFKVLLYIAVCATIVTIGDFFTDLMFRLKCGEFLIDTSHASLSSNCYVTESGVLYFKSDTYIHDLKKEYERHRNGVLNPYKQ